MDIYAFDAFCPKEVIEKDGVKAVASAEELYSACDIVSLHIPATAETKNSINYALVGRMPKGGLLVNTARKEVIKRSRADTTDGRTCRLEVHDRHNARSQ